MKTLLSILVLIFLFSCSPSSTTNTENQKAKAIQDSIQKVKADSIRKAEAEKQAYLNRPWQIGEFVDNFGDKSGRKYIQTRSSGTFSNSATTNSFLSVEFFITTKNAGLFLHEYSSERSAVKFIGDGTIIMKNEAGDKISINTSDDWNQQGGILISNTYYNQLVSFLKKSSGTVRVYVADEYSSSYNFSISLLGFNEELILLNKK